MQFESTLARDDADLAVTVHANHVRAYRAHRPRLEPPCDPDEPEHYEIDWVEGPDGESVEVSMDELERLAGEAWEHHPEPD
jgi:hypothetical protein